MNAVLEYEPYLSDLWYQTYCNTGNQAMGQSKMFKREIPIENEGNKLLLRTSGYRIRISEVHPNS